jgi:hypothetical protein
LILIQNLIKTLVYGNLIVAFSGALLSSSFVKLVSIDSYIEYGLFTFFGILALYNYHRLSKMNALMNADLKNWCLQHKTLLYALIIISFIGALFLVQRLIIDIEIVVLLLIPTVSMSIWYIIPIFNIRLRDIPFVKAPIVALSWTSVLIVFPLINQYSLTVNDYFRILAFVLYFLALTIPFDIRDKHVDIKNQRTLPQIAGNAFSKVVALLCLLGFYSFLAIIHEYLRFSIPFLVAMFFTAALFLLSNERRSYAFFALVDFSMALIALAFFYK